MRVTIDHGSIEILQGDITRQDTEAIVNAANNHLWMGGGVAGAIKRIGGEEIESEAVAQGPIEIGEAVGTSAGTLQAKYVIHAAVMGQDLHTDSSYIQAATRSALILAESKQLASIAFPALGTGVGGFSVFHCAKIMLTEVIDVLMRSKHLHHVRFVLFDKSTFDAFEQEMKLQFSAKRH
ncbi:MAG: macro domain-containing protein [Ignavibacteria bacterium]|nr:macro domain-containing protein [Ignavibacteria bacterium]MBI3765243.1 macro domain-containing protein [Ignavibacteriales bacterium]